MFTQRQTNLERALCSTATLLLLLTTAGQSTCSPTTAAPPVSNSSLTKLSNRSMEEPHVLPLQRSCGSKHSEYCLHGGTCMYPQDSDKPYCICNDSYRGIRCEDYSLKVGSKVEMEQIIGIVFGVMLVVGFLALVITCFAYKKCMKSSPLIKVAPSETSV